jgi:hypothetical protein
MSELVTSFGAADDDAGVAETATGGQLRERSSGATVLITEQEVLFGTAAAKPLVPAKTGRRWARMVGGARPRRHFPARNDYLESSRMAREMYRL